MSIVAEKILEVKNLKAYFPGRNETVKAVDGVSFEVYKGETFGLVGESGCGKSQTCRSILGLLKKPGQVVDGQIILDGQDITHLKEKELRKLRGKEMSVIFQEPMTSLSPVLKIKKQLMEVFDGEPMTKAEKKKRAIELLKMVGIPSPEARMEEYTFQFSGGMRQRAMIAMALGAKPKLLIADEPTTALDVTIQAQIISLIRDLQKELGFTTIYITHDLGVVANVADRVGVMYGGQIIEYGNVEEVFFDPRHPYTWALLSSLPQLGVKGQELYYITGTPPSLYNQIKGDAFAPRNEHALKIDFEMEPPFFPVSETHYAKTWLLDPRAPKLEKPEAIRDLHEKIRKMTDKGGAFHVE